MDRLKELEHRLRKAVGRHWTYELDQLGDEALPFWRVRVPTRGRQLYHVVLAAGIHGDEPAGVEALLRLLEHQDFPANAAFECFPCMNPEGYAAGTREDASGRDLNRQFGVPACAPTVAWFQNCYQGGRADMYIDFHEDVDTRGFYMYEVTDASDRYAPGIVEAVQRGGFGLEPAADLHAMLVADGLGYAARVTQDGVTAPLPSQMPAEASSAQAGFMAARCERTMTFESPSQGEWECRVRMHLQAAQALFARLQQTRSALLPNAFRAAEGRRPR